MPTQKVSLKALEVFLAVARRGTLRDAAQDLGVSTSTASHHLTELEKSIGAPLIDHSKRPMVLTQAGAILRQRAEEAMGSLNLGLSEIWAEDAERPIRALRLAMIEDFDADVAPALTKDLVDALPRCDLTLLSRPTHEILDLLQTQQIDIGVAATSDFDGGGMRETTFLRDPFILLLPQNIDLAPESLADLQAVTDSLPLLRYHRQQLLGQRVEAQLRRLNLRFPRQMAFETTHVILSLVAAGHGWTLTTALSFARAQRYHADLRVRPVPGAAFAREISVFSKDDVPVSVSEQATWSLRQSIERMVLQPTLARYPWLQGQFALIDPSKS